MKVSEKSQDLLIKAGLFVVAYLVIAKPVFNFLGITKSKGDRIRAKELSDPNSPFKMEYWKRYYKYPGKIPYTGKTLSGTRKKELEAAVKKLYDAFGYLTDDEDIISAVIYSLKTKSEVSIFATYFYIAYKKDLLTYLSNGKDLMPQNGLGDYELNIILTYVDALPAS